MNKKVVYAFMVTVLALALAACGPAVPPASPTEVPHLIRVNGSGKVTLAPDMAVISIGVVTEDREAQVAVEANNRQTEAIMGALEDEGIAAADIQTTNFSIYPQQEWGEGRVPQIVSYRVQNTVEVTVRELDNLGQVLTATVRAGANNISGIRFDVSDREAAIQDAMEAAVENARSRAETLAAAAGIELGAVHSLESFVHSGGGVYVERAMMDAGGGEVPISPGEMDITVEVTMAFEIK